MPELLAPPLVFRTFGDLLEHLGGVSPTRVRYFPFPGTATEQHVLDIEAKENRLYELVDGILVEKAMGFWESVIASVISAALNAFVLPRRLGVVAGADGMVRLFPDLKLIRMPDVSYVSNERLPPSGDRLPVPQLAPDLAVEVISEGNTVKEMQQKRREYFDAGVRLAWFVDLKSQTIAVYTSVDEPKILKATDVLDGGDLLPGFTMELAPLFALARQ